ncbi:hypothetical protein JMN32_07540 [Fulvivirga sp. 29W222]|uniref:DUF3278 domain-containing protein n=1 Tax=Fulvivirga marina TaxID=2494733 RepID=A0A937FU79_9BACT|nr:hypothetical protein [Fulvivirga marina]MBL6446155.1 hypothetical protein [Fulvivirga marina]
MDNFESLQSAWKDSKQDAHAGMTAKDMQHFAMQNHSKSKKFHLGNVAILALVCIGISLFFYFIAPMQEAISRLGIVLMVGGLVVRIVIELVSHRKADQIEFNVDTKTTALQASKFYNWRKRIHGPVTVTIVSLYSLGFYLLTPEFLDYIPKFWVVIMDIGYVIIAVILTIVIYTGIKKEMAALREIKDIRSELE